MNDHFGYRVFPVGYELEMELKKELGESKPPVLIIHGFPSHTTKHHDLATRLALRGWATYMIHHEGFGESKGKFSFLPAVEKMREIASYIAKIHGSDKIHLIGHSFGGFVSLAIKELASSLTLLCPLFTFDKKSIDDFVPRTFVDHKDNLRYTSEKELEEGLHALLAKYPASKLVSGLSEMDTFLLHGTNDETIPVESSRTLSEFLGSESTYKEVEDDHRFFEDRVGLMDLVSERFQRLGKQTPKLH